MRGRGMSPIRSWTRFTKYLIICSVTSKSLMTPSRSGRTAMMLAGVRPTIRLASAPMARTRLVLASMATTLGSLMTIPRSRTWTSVFAVPRSIPMSREKRPSRRSSMVGKVLVGGRGRRRRRSPGRDRGRAAPRPGRAPEGPRSIPEAPGRSDLGRPVPLARTSCGAHATMHADGSGSWRRAHGIGSTRRSIRRHGEARTDRCRAASAWSSLPTRSDTGRRSRSSRPKSQMIGAGPPLHVHRDCDRVLLRHRGLRDVMVRRRPRDLCARRRSFVLRAAGCPAHVPERERRAVRKLEPRTRPAAMVGYFDELAAGIAEGLDGGRPGRDRSAATPWIVVGESRPTRYLVDADRPN